MKDINTIIDRWELDKILTVRWEMARFLSDNWGRRSENFTDRKKRDKMLIVSKEIAEKLGDHRDSSTPIQTFNLVKSREKL